MDKKSPELNTVRAMIRIYCHDTHQEDRLCASCAELQHYAEERLTKCPFGIQKPTCQNCRVHCYEPRMRERIKKVMRYAGPRMLWHHPLLAIRHLIHNRRIPQENKPGTDRSQR